MQTDYLVIGAGAMGMAFADTLLTETDCTLTIVDRYHRPGGHWTTAYPFVRLHQPSAFYGVNSKALGTDSVDQVGWNKGLYELASCDEVCAYFGQVMNQRLLPSGRVSYLPLHEYLGDGRCKSLLTGQVLEVKAQRRVVDATYMRVTVPSMRPPPYRVATGVRCIPPNELVKPKSGYQRYTIVGAGKTGIDSCLWLLANGVDPSALTWVMPRDSWLIDRSTTQPGREFTDATRAIMAGQGAAIMEANSVDELLDRVVACGSLRRFSDAVRPTMFRCASVSPAELEQLRKIKNIVRLGRVKSLEQGSMVLDGGSVPAPADTLYIDCSADGLERRPAVPVFEGRTMRLQAVRYCQQVFSAAFIGYVEAAYADDAIKNELCRPVPHPDDTRDWLRTTRATYESMLRWNDEPKVLAWLANARLDWFGRMSPPMPTDPTERAAAFGKVREAMRPLIAKLGQLLDASAGDAPTDSRAA
jgi:NAD(P)-binding Rossmann-like domain